MVAKINKLETILKVPDFSYSYSPLKFLIMREKQGFTIVEQAVALVPEFEKVVSKLEQRVTLRGQSKSRNLVTGAE